MVKEAFSDEQLAVLEHFVTNTSGNIFALRNLPEVVKGALFSRYSRSTSGLRTLLLKEFLFHGESDLDILSLKQGSLSTDLCDKQAKARKLAQGFYDRILDGYGDDSIGELGGAHLAIENVSMLAAKALEDARIGGSPLEKSTRYVFFDQKENDQFLYYREPVLMTSAFRNSYEKTCNHLFETYGSLIPPVTELVEKNFPRGPEKTKSAYAAAIRAKILDMLRGLLPASAFTNLGMFGNGRFWEMLLNKMQSHNLVELSDIGRGAYEELSKVIPSFVRRAHHAHRYHESLLKYFSSTEAQLKKVASHLTIPVGNNKPGVSLVSYDADAVVKVAAGLLFSQGDHSLKDLHKYCAQLSKDRLANIFEAATSMREQRRQKSPRGLEFAHFTFEIVADFGIYRDLHRHRMLTQERQLLTTFYGYFIPEELLGTPMEKSYREALLMAEDSFRLMVGSFQEEAQYVVPMAYNLRWYFHVNLRALQWLCELRSQQAGHPGYRTVAQELARQVIEIFPLFESFFKFVDFSPTMTGRLDQEIKQQQNKESS